MELSTTRFALNISNVQAVAIPLGTIKSGISKSIFQIASNTHMPAAKI